MAAITKLDQFTIYNKVCYSNYFQKKKGTIKISNLSLAQFRFYDIYRIEKSFFFVVTVLKSFLTIK